VSAADLAQRERRALCDLFVQVGPDAATLCEGWTTADLAAHLVLRERKPLAAPGILFGGRVAAYTERVQRELRDGTGYAVLVDRVRQGPPLPLRPLDGLVNLSEYFIHHEDVRRGDGSTGPRPADDVADVEAALWKVQGRGTKLMTRRLEDVDLTLATPTGDTKHVGGGSRPVTIRGRPGEVVLFLSGRRAAAEVDLTGDTDAVDEVRTGDLGL
jgi:uncharacterized protein (TIGR03085 family)